MATKILDHDAAATLYAGGLSTTQIAEVFGVSARTVLVALRRRGVTLRSLSASVSLRKRGSRTVCNGYVFIRVAKGRRVREHVLVAEKALGRPLAAGEHVHHINRDTLDNRPCNLLVCSRAYHIELHWRMRQHPYWSQIEKGQKQ